MLLLLVVVVAIVVVVIGSGGMADVEPVIERDNVPPGEGLTADVLLFARAIVVVVVVVVGL